MTEVEMIEPNLGGSTLTKKSLRALRSKIIRLYKQDQRPWVIGYSGGKDSTAVVQLIWDALLELRKTESLSKTVHILSSDTLVETPAVVDALRENLVKMEKAANQQKIPVEVDLVAPPANQSFWVNLIGRGYPAPTTTFRWCTDRLKIAPANKFILDTVSKHGEAVLVLGVRSEESTTRAQSIELYKNKAAEPDFSTHTSLPGALVYAPIVDWTTHDIWDFLGQSTPPWGGSHRDLITMYRNAQAGECPLVVDKTTSSCGNSRFGCWTCTVVSADKSMEALSETEDGSGEWLEHLLDFRAFLFKTTKPENKINYRQVRRRDGSIRFRDKNSSTLIWGPYTPEFREELLTELLKTEQRVREDGPHPDMELINDAELLRIREIWSQEPNPAFFLIDPARILEENSERKIAWPQSDDFGQKHQEYKALEEAASKHKVPSEVLTKMLKVEEEFRYSASRKGINKKLLSALKSSWLSREEVLSERERRKIVEEEIITNED